MVETGVKCGNCIELDGDFNLVWLGWWRLRVGNKNGKSTHNADLLLGFLTFQFWSVTFIFFLSYKVVTFFKLWENLWVLVGFSSKDFC